MWIHPRLQPRGIPSTRVGMAQGRIGQNEVGDSLNLIIPPRLPLCQGATHISPVIKSKDRTPGDERDARFRRQIAGRHEIFFNNLPLSPKGGKS